MGLFGLPSESFPALVNWVHLQMADLTYPTDLDLAGPWLVTAEQLEALDEIVEREWGALQTSVESRLSKRSVAILLKDGKRLSGRTFKEASAHPEVVTSRVIGLGMELSNGETRCFFSLGGPLNKNLRLSVSGTNQQSRERLFSQLRYWVTDCQAPGWQRAWNWVASEGFQWLLWWIVVSVSWIILAEIMAGKGDSHYIDAAHKLLAKGLDSKDLTKALELILALESHYQPTNSTEIPIWILLVTFGGLLVCIALSIRPRIEVGLGKGKARLRLWNLWMRFVAVTLPLFVVATVARNIISAIIGKIWGA
jgi:hypothetical protein